MPLLIALSNPPINLVVKGELSEHFKKNLWSDDWLQFLSVSDELIMIRTSSINSIQEISEEKQREFESNLKKEDSRISKPNFIIPKKGQN